MPNSDILRDFCGSSTVLSERYEQEVAHILSSLGDFWEDYKYSLITDDTLFNDFASNPYSPIDSKALKKISSDLGLDIRHDMKVVDVAKKIFESRIDKNRLQ